MATFLNINETIINFDNLEVIERSQYDDGTFCLKFHMVSGQVVSLGFSSIEERESYLSELLA